MNAVTSTSRALLQPVSAVGHESLRKAAIERVYDSAVALAKQDHRFAMRLANELATISKGRRPGRTPVSLAEAGMVAFTYQMLERDRPGITRQEVWKLTAALMGITVEQVRVRYRRAKAAGMLLPDVATIPWLIPAK